MSYITMTVAVQITVEGVVSKDLDSALEEGYQRVYDTLTASSPMVKVQGVDRPNSLDNWDLG